VQESRFQFEKVMLFLDSEIVLAWIRSEARKFKLFVSVRVGEIQTNTDPSQWKHIPGELNVADDDSRGIPVRSLADRWQHGPKFLRLPENQWHKIHQTVTNLKLKKSAVKLTTFALRSRQSILSIVKSSQAGEGQSELLLTR